MRAEAVVASAVVLVLAGCGTGTRTEPASSVAHDAVVLVDPTSGRAIGSFPLPGEPLRVSAGAGAFWAVVPEQRALVRIDPRRGAVAVRLVGEEPFDAAVGGGAVWVADHDGHRILRVGGRGETARSNDFGVPCLAIAYAFGAVWVVAADETLTRLDPGSLRPTGAVANVAQSVEHYEPKIAVGDDALWVADAVSNSVARVDPVGLRVTRRVAKGGAGVAVGSSGIWSTDSFGSVWRVADGRQAKVRTGAGAVDVAAGGGFLWVVNRFAGTLVRVDPRALRVTETIHLRGSPIAVAYGDGYLAVAVRAST